MERQEWKGNFQKPFIEGEKKNPDYTEEENQYYVDFQTTRKQ